MGGLFQVNVALKIILREPAEFFGDFSPRTQNFKNAVLFFPGVIFQQWELLGFYAIYTKLLQGIFFHRVLYEFFHSHPNNFQQVSAQSFTSGCSTTISEWTPGFPGLSDAANCLQIQQPPQQEKAGSLEMENVQDHKASYKDQGDIAWINLGRSEENHFMIQL